MASTPTPRNRLALQGTGDNIGTWGTVLNEQTLDLVDEALDGVEAITVSSNVTLSSANYASDQARHRVLKFSGLGGFTVTIPGVEKFYVIHNNCTSMVTVSTSSGTNARIEPKQITFMYCDGANCFGATYTGSSTFAQKIVAPPSSPSSASLRLPHGNPPTAPINGDMWTGEVVGLSYRIDGVTRSVGMELLSSGSFAGVSRIVLNLVGGYRSYRIIGSGMRPAITSPSAIALLVSQDNGATFKSGATDYQYAADSIDSAGNRWVYSNPSYLAILLTFEVYLSVAGSTDSILDIQINNPSGTNNFKTIMWRAGYTNPLLRSESLHGSGFYRGNDAAINSIALFGTGTASTRIHGHVSLYGVR